ncbi:MAG TPA: alpha/beta fold hydrolase, partial [Hyphomonadaceae bacterium]|nr:alpha/beta fold hydrolase [Hyphomonadaceae bacterium]
MISAFIPWLVGGSVAVLIALLVVVQLARRMEQRDSARPRVPMVRGGRKPPRVSAPPKAAVSPAKPSAINPAIGLALGGVAGMGAVNLLERLRRARGDDGSGESARARKRAGAASIGVVVAVITAIGAAIGSIKSSPREVTMSEIAAGDLHGTYVSAGKHRPVVLIVPGSGPTDRDGNNPMGVKANSYALLADGLAQKGISTVRVDKRGMFGSAGAGNPNAVSVDIYAQDYRAWVDAIRKEAGVKCVWLLGHSEGALMVSAAAQGRKVVCGLILVSGAGR